LSTLAKTLYGPSSKATQAWRTARYQELEAGDVKAVVAAMKRARPRDPAGREQVRKEIGSFQTNAERMRYAEFRRRGLFVGSGVVEAGCKPLWGGASSSPGCDGLYGEPTPSSPCAAANSAAAGKNSGRHERQASSFLQICRTPDSDSEVDRTFLIEVFLVSDAQKLFERRMTNNFRRNSARILASRKECYA
jgi:hypothetical protein